MLNEIEKIRVFKQNQVYRIGDALLQTGTWQKCRRLILHQPEYTNTLLCNFLKKYSIGDKPVNMKQFREFVNQSVVRTPDNEILLHLRCGDVVDQECVGRHGKVFITNPTKMIECLNESLKPQIDQVRIITAMHYGPNFRPDIKKFRWSAEKHQINIELLSELFHQISSYFNLPVVVDTNDKLSDLEFIDYQFLKLVHADSVILDHSGFARIIQRLRKWKS